MDKMTDKIKVKPFDNLFMRCHFGFGSKLVGLCKGKCWPVFSGSCWSHAVLMKRLGGGEEKRKKTKNLWELFIYVSIIYLSPG